MFIFDVLIFIIVLGVIILIHEFGHFFFAKRAGILCHEFSLGMGPAIYQRRSGETVYSIRAIPIGGYVAMAGESVNDALIKKGQIIGVRINEQGQIYEIILSEALSSDKIGVVKNFDLYGKNFDPLYIDLTVEEETISYPVLRNALYRFNDKKEMWITPAEKSFESKTLWQRFLVIFAGPVMNFLLALVLFLIVGFFLFKPNLDSNIVDEVGEGTPAELAGLLPGDKITYINGNPINSWYDLSATMDNLDSPVISFSYERNGVQTDVEDVAVATVIQMAGLANVDQDGTIHSQQAIIGQAFSRATTDGGLMSGDLITKISVDGFEHDISSWNDIIAFFKVNNRGDITVFYTRDGKEEQTTYALISERALGKLGHDAIIFRLGVSPTSSFDLGYTLTYPFRAFGDTTGQVFNTIGLLFDPSEDIGIGDLSGPVGIFSLVSRTASQGVIALIGFTAFLSINIGLLNLMPIPALDGGRLVFLGIEAVTKKPLNKKIENTVNNVMFFLLIGLFIFVTYNDIVRLIKG